MKSTGKSNLASSSCARAVWLPASPSRSPWPLERPQRRSGIGIEVGLAESFPDPRLEATCPLLVQVEPWLEPLEDLPVVQPLLEHGSEHRRERMARHTHPVRPGAVLPGFVHKGLADVEHHRTRALLSHH